MIKTGGGTISFNLFQLQRKTNVLKERKNEKNVFKMIIMDKI